MERFWKRHMLPGVLNLYADKPFAQLIKHRHLTKQRLVCSG